MFYLFASFVGGQHRQGRATVFLQVEGEMLAKALVELFAKEYSDSGAIFSSKAAIEIPLHEQILLDEAIEDLNEYSDPDRGIYHPPPPLEMHQRAQYARRANKWESFLRRRSVPISGGALKPENDIENNQSPEGSGLLEMTTEEFQNSARILLMQFSQVYYKLLECAIANGVAAVDLELNHSYLWITANISKLLTNSDLVDFPCAFEPLIPDLYPSTLLDIEWEDMAAPPTEQFLSAVQRYICDKGTYQPEEGSLPWTFIEMFRPGLDVAVEKADNYRKRMRGHYQKMLESVSRTDTNAGSSGETPPKASNHTKEDPSTRNLAFICYSHKDKKLMSELLVHLKPFQRSHSVQVWSDKMIAAGSQWFEEIGIALKRTKVAILMVSPHFLASDFIHEHELSVLLKDAEKGGLRIVWIPVAACSYKETPLRNYQSVVSPDKPLAAMSPSARNTAWVAICGEIRNALEGTNQ